MEKNITRSCIDCGVKNCDSMDRHYPKFCVSEALDRDWLGEVLNKYQEEENQKIAIASATIESDFYCRMTRVQETIEFAKRIGAKKVGIASCVGLLKESHVLAGLLREEGFEVFGAGCKIGTVPKHQIGIPERCEDVGTNMCNPIMQAELLNRENTDLNIVMGLCVGHDSLFYKYSRAVTTTLVTKDRVLVHNPAAALYAADSYYAQKLHPKKEQEKD